MPHADSALANPGLLGRVLDWVRAHVPEGSDIANLAREDLRHIAEDLSLADSDLLAMSTAGRDNTILMKRMMRARGLDPAQVRHAFGTLFRDVERVCTQCETSGRCRRELDVGMAAEHCHEFCPNAGTFDDLVEIDAH
jgi:hypothetical protein